MKSHLHAAAVVAALAVAAAIPAAFAQDEASIRIVPPLTGFPQPMEEVSAPPVANPVTDAPRPVRNYPEQPPVIPHSIDGYQLSLAANRCLECHRRQYTDLVGAPMISFTHFMDRDGQMLADVAPRRYFCTACHVQQTDARPLVLNEFQDMLSIPAAAE